VAQLSDDCFAFGGPLLSVEAGIARIAEQVRPLDRVEEVPLWAADGRVLARDLLAPVSLPPFDNSAVDGYAVRFSDLAPGAPTRLRVEGRAAAGSAPEPLRPGTARRIFTGAVLPEGADTVFMQEDVERRPDGSAVLPAGLKEGANRRISGEDVAAGELALPAGRRLTPQDLALAAGLGLDRLTVHARVRIAIFSTGDEVAEPGRPLVSAKLYDANRPFLGALAARAGAEVRDLGILPDDREATAAAIGQAAAEHDLVLTSGGVSTGEEDHVKAAVENVGRLVFWRLAIKPGRPVAMGVIGGTPFVGLPGNPVAVFVTFAHVARPLIAALGGARFEPRPALPVRAAFTYAKKPGRREYVRVALERGADGVWSARKHPREGAGLLTSLTRTHGLAELPEETTRVEPGDLVGFLPYELLY